MMTAQPPGSARPAWLPEAVRVYLEHTEDGLSLRALARRKGCAASTVMRQVRRYENRRDDPLVDPALTAFGRSKASPPPSLSAKDTSPMTAPIRSLPRVTDDLMLAAEARRVLRRLIEPGAVLAIARTAAGNTVAAAG